jgi:hypothetical protein
MVMALSALSVRAVIAAVQHQEKYIVQLKAFT